MSGHGSPPPHDRGPDPRRRVARQASEIAQTLGGGLTTSRVISVAQHRPNKEEPVSERLTNMGVT